MMVSGRAAILTVLVLGLQAVPEAQAATRHAHPGENTDLGGFVTLKGNYCDGGPFPQISVQIAPAHGEVTTEPGEVKLSRLASGSTICVGKSAKGVHVFYQSAANFVGADHLVYLVTYNTRSSETIEVDIAVAPQAAHASRPQAKGVKAN